MGLSARIRAGHDAHRISVNPTKTNRPTRKLHVLVLNTAGMTLIPVSVMAQRRSSALRTHRHLHPDAHRELRRHAGGAGRGRAAAAHSPDGSRDPRVDRGITAFLVGVVWYFTVFLTRAEIQAVSNLVGNILILSVIVGFIGGALYKAPMYTKSSSRAQGRDPDFPHDHPVPRRHAGRDRVLRNSGVLDMLVERSPGPRRHGSTPNSPVIADRAHEIDQRHGARAMRSK